MKFIYLNKIGTDSFLKFGSGVKEESFIYSLYYERRYYTYIELNSGRNETTKRGRTR